MKSGDISSRIRSPCTSVAFGFDQFAIPRSHRLASHENRKFRSCKCGREGPWSLIGAKIHLWSSWSTMSLGGSELKAWKRAKPFLPKILEISNHLSKIHLCQGTSEFGAANLRRKRPAAGAKGYQISYQRGITSSPPDLERFCLRHVCYQYYSIHRIAISTNQINQESWELFAKLI